MDRPIIAIPIGDPAGIGPEIVLKALLSREAGQAARCVAIGDRRVLEDAAGFCGLQVRFKTIEKPEDGEYIPGTANVVDLGNIAPGKFQMGKVSGMCGKAAYEYIERSVRLANEGRVAAVSTAPINKEALKEGGINFIGHTEIFGALTQTEDPLTMFEVRGLRIFFLTRHMSLRQACDAITKERVTDYVKRCREALRRLGVPDGTMAIAGLNPHSGEHGLFGNEETEEIVPAIRELKGQGYDVEGPVGADSVFHLALKGRYNSVLSLYHDQGHIASKTLDFERTVAVTNGMPILRTSVDHGTAFDVAGKGVASEVSMVEAIKVAAKYAPNFEKQSMREEGKKG